MKKKLLSLARGVAPGLFCFALCAVVAPAQTATNLADTKSFVKQVNGDLGATANAYWDGTNWQRVDTTKPAFWLQMQGTNNIPGETVPGVNLWVAQPGPNPIAAVGAVGGWLAATIVTSDRLLVVGGNGIELDGYGLSPYARFIHSNLGGTPVTGMLTNLFPDLSGVDSSSQPSWFAGFNGDTYMVERAQAGSGAALAQLFSVDALGTARFTPSSATHTCASSGDIGKLWVNNATSTTAVQVCVSTSGSIGWKKATLQ
jgi:hypothetical protein